ncbi:MAG: hypothetical protein J6R83_03555, partial [Clostridia bacterium]|nr:hypothetical protein [Clostridia bacterium]
TDYLDTATNCTEKAKYFYSCECGEKGTETFENGEALGHNYGAWTSNADGTHTKTCANDATHVVTENCAGGTATCEGKPVCETCETEYGTALGHDYGAWVSVGNDQHAKTCANDPTHVITESCHGGTATCTEKAVCDDCGAEHGSTLPH